LRWPERKVRSLNRTETEEDRSALGEGDSRQDRAGETER